MADLGHSVSKTPFYAKVLCGINNAPRCYLFEANSKEDGEDSSDFVKNKRKMAVRQGFEPWVEL